MLRKWLVVLTLGMVVIGLQWKLVDAVAKNPQQKDPTETAAKSPELKRVTTATLGGEDRYITYLATDKPMYRPGEQVYIRATMLHHLTNKPFPAETSTQALIDIKGPKGDSVASGFVKSEQSVFGFQWKVPADQAGGEYTIKISHPSYGYAPAERKFDIRNYRAPRLKGQIKFVRKGYGPGDQVAASLSVDRAEGGHPVGAKVTTIGRVDGAEVYRAATHVDESGFCSVRFPLPEQIERGEGSLAFVVEDGGIVETVSKTIPILLQTVDLTMFPEGGELVNGLTSRVYFEAKTPSKKPADIAGIVVDDQGKEVGTFRSEHEGRGRFEFTPQVDRTYSLKITAPTGIKKTFALPAAKAMGVTLRAKKDVFNGTSVKLSIQAAAEMPVWVTLTKQEKEIVRQPLDITRAQQWTPVKLDVPEEYTGVLVATVWTKAGVPLAERLVFRNPQQNLRIKISSDKKRYVPGEKASLTVRTTDEEGEPVSAIVGLSVTDDSVLEMVDKREQAARLPVMVLLEKDVRELADAHIYLDRKNDESELAVDLLLGVQGWRRFAFVKTTEFLAQHGDLGRRALGVRITTSDELNTVTSRLAIDGINRLEARFRFRDGIPAPGAAPPPLPAVPAAAADPFGAPVEAAPVPQRAVADQLAAPAPPEKAEAVGRPAPQPEAPAEPQPVAENARRQIAPLGNEALRANVALEASAEFKEAQAIASRERQELAKVLSAKKRKTDAARLPFASKPQQIRNDLIFVRVYAHHNRTNRQPGERTDFTETLFWHAGIKTNDKGVATFEFDLNDSVTSFRVFADAFDADGHLSANSQLIESVEPFYVEPKVPLAVTAGDRVLVPLGFVNETGTPLDAQMEWVAPQFEVDTASIGGLSIAPGERVRRLASLLVGNTPGVSDLTLRAKAGAYRDSVSRSIKVEPRGFPLEIGHGGLLAADGERQHTIEIPVDVVVGSVTARAVVYPTPLASMTESLKRLIREPGGCFEQTSSTTYPLVMAQQYFMSHQGVDPSLVEKSSDILARGYKRLIGFESKSGGFEWFGGDPGHDALTAYGLMQFTDMAQVHDVDPAMLKRTREWLLEQRDGKGGYTRRTRTLHTWLTDPEVANSYNTWALLVAGVDADLSTEVDWVERTSISMSNTYAIALAANVLALADRKDAANRLLDKLAGLQTEDGSLTGATKSVVGSGGAALQIETTALAVTAWLSNSSYVPQVEKSIKYIAENCKAGRFGSTQSTVLALRAIVAYDQSRATPKAPGELQLVIDGKEFGEPIPFTAETQGAIELPDFSKELTAGKHDVQVRMKGGSSMPYSVAIDLHREKPDSSRDCKLHLEATLRDTNIDEGSLTEINVTVINRTGETTPSPIAIVGIPGGLEVQHDQLKELVKAEKIAAYEVLGREVVLYWRAFEAEQRVELPIRVTAAIPGTYTGPASRAYLYYTDEVKNWIDGFEVEIAAK